MTKKWAVNKPGWLISLTLLLLLFGCGQISQNQPAANSFENQFVGKNKPNDTVERDDNLQADTDALLPLFDDMPSVPVYIEDAPVLKSGTNTEKGVAYTQCDNHLFPSIFVKKIFYQKTNRKQLVNILKHELTHAWLCRQEKMWGHDAGFRKKFTQIGGFGN